MNPLHPQSPLWHLEAVATDASRGSVHSEQPALGVLADGVQAFGADARVGRLTTDQRIDHRSVRIREQIGQRVLDFGPLEEPQSPYTLYGIRPDRTLLQTPGTGRLIDRGWRSRGVGRHGPPNRESVAHKLRSSRH